MKKFILISCVCIVGIFFAPLFSFGGGNPIENAYRQVESKRIIVNYDLVGVNPTPLGLYGLVKVENKDELFPVPAIVVKGAINKEVSPGKNLRAEWDIQKIYNSKHDPNEVKIMITIDNEIVKILKNLSLTYEMAIEYENDIPAQIEECEEQREEVWNSLSAEIRQMARENVSLCYNNVKLMKEFYADLQSILEEFYKEFVLTYVSREILKRSVEVKPLSNVGSQGLQLTDPYNQYKIKIVDVFSGNTCLDKGYIYSSDVESSKSKNRKIVCFDVLVENSSVEWAPLISYTDFILIDNKQKKHRSIITKKYISSKIDIGEKVSGLLAFEIADNSSPYKLVFDGKRSLDPEDDSLFVVSPDISKIELK